MGVEDCTGIIIAGGYSTRFGPTNKALAVYRDHPLLYHVASAVLEVTNELIINCREDQHPAYAEILGELPGDITFAIDPIPGKGPLFGLRTACEARPSTTAIVVACDMPLVDEALLGHLLGYLDEYDAAIPQSTDGYYHLTHAAYRVTPLQEAIEQAIRDENDRLTDLRSFLEYATITETEIRHVSDIATLRSIDTTRELRELRHKHTE